jgi:hypothetical protein
VITAAERVRSHRLVAQQQQKQEQQERLDHVVAEFNGDLHAMAKEILRYRHAVKQMADAIGWMQTGAPFANIGPGPYWQRPPRARED